MESPATCLPGEVCAGSEERGGGGQVGTEEADRDVRAFLMATGAS